MGGKKEWGKKKKKKDSNKTTSNHQSHTQSDFRNGSTMCNINAGTDHHKIIIF